MDRFRHPTTALYEGPRHLPADEVADIEHHGERQVEESRRDPDDERARVRCATTYFLWIEGVLALSVLKVTLSYPRWRGFLPAYYVGFTATCRDEDRAECVVDFSKHRGVLPHSACAEAVGDSLQSGPGGRARAGKLPEYWEFYESIREHRVDSWALGVRGMPGEPGGHGYDALRTVMYRKLTFEHGPLLEFFKTIYFFVESLTLIGAVPARFPAAERGS